MYIWLCQWFVQFQGPCWPAIDLLLICFREPEDIGQLPNWSLAKVVLMISDPLALVASLASAQYMHDKACQIQDLGSLLAPTLSNPIMIISQKASSPHKLLLVNSTNHAVMIFLIFFLGRILHYVISQFLLGAKKLWLKTLTFQHCTV